MIRATSILRRPAVRPERVADTLTLDHVSRHRRRISLTAAGGLAFLLDLDRATVLDDGDAVKLEDGRLVQIRAAPETLIEIRTDNPLRLMQIAWHLGNRHVATELGTDALYIAHDHVLLEMVRGLGGTAIPVERPFRPERGAYDLDGQEHAGHGHAGHSHGSHDHSAHDHAGHDHAGHGHDAHDHAGHAQEGGEHVHGAACGCGHDHGHAHAGHSHDAHGQSHSHD